MAGAIMLERAEVHAETLAERAAARACARVQDAVTQAFPDLTVSIETRGVVLKGRGLMRRLFSDARLRWIAALIR